jgi:nucleoside-diphosphate-sugar epimerase
MQVLITGGAGYMGSVLARLLVYRGDRVRVLDNLMHGGAPIQALIGEPGFDFMRGDIGCTKTVAAAVEGVDAVVHLAAIVGDPACAHNVELARKTNIDGTLSVYERAKAAGVSRFVFASTCSNYGLMSATDDFLTEDAPLRPVSFYAESKVEIEKNILGDSQERMHSLVLRFATLYGLSPRMRFDLTVNEFTAELLTSKTLCVYGEQFWRPYVHVRDAAVAIITSLNAAPELIHNNVFNVGDSRQNLRKLDLVGLIREVVPDGEVQYVSRKEDPRDYRVAFEKIQSKLGFKIQMSVPDGIREIARAIQSGVFADVKNPSYRN